MEFGLFYTLSFILELELNLAPRVMTITHTHTHTHKMYTKEAVICRSGEVVVVLLDHRLERICFC